MSNAVDVAGCALQVIAVIAGAPLVIGVTRQVRARAEGRAGAGIAQPWRDLRKLLRKQNIHPYGTSVVFAAAPVILFALAVVLAAVCPLVAVHSPLGSSADLFVVVGLLFLTTVVLTLAGLDTATAFGGMGASREITIAALVEPTILLAAFALSTTAHSAELGDIVAATHVDPGRVLSPSGLLSFAALAVVVVAETGRLPVDNPATHLELTMVHEAMTLEYAGPRLALVESASAMRLTVLLALLANLFVPVGIFTGDHHAVPGLALGLVVIVVKVLVLAAVMSFAEVFVAKLRLFRVPELLAGSFVLALLSVVAASFFATGAGG